MLASPKSALRLIVIGGLILITGFCGRIGVAIYARSLLQEMHTSLVNGGGLDFLVSDSVVNLKIGTALSYFLMLLGTAFLIAGILKNRRVSLPEPQIEEAEQGGDGDAEEAV
jgi:hypothetical protein